MNRAQRRAYNKQNHTTLSKQEFEVAIALSRLQSGLGLDDEQLKTLLSTGIAHLDNERLVPTGTPVKINAEGILERDHNTLQQDYIEWVEANRDTIFHLDREEGHNSLVCLAEDHRTTELDGETVECPRWLFDLYADILVEYEGEWITVADYDVKRGKEEDGE